MDMKKLSSRDLNKQFVIKTSIEKVRILKSSIMKCDIEKKLLLFSKRWNKSNKLSGVKNAKINFSFEDELINSISLFEFMIILTYFETNLFKIFSVDLIYFVDGWTTIQKGEFNSFFKMLLINMRGTQTVFPVP